MEEIIYVQIIEEVLTSLFADDMIVPEMYAPANVSPHKNSQNQ